LVSSFP